MAEMNAQVGKRSVEPLYAIPDHVRADLVWNNTVGSLTTGTPDPYRAVAKLHDGPDIIFVKPCPEMPRGAWIPTRFDMVRDIFLDAEHFSSRGTTDYAPIPFRLSPQDYDPPEHQAYRQVLQPYFLPSAIHRYEENVRRIANELISKFQDRGSCDFIKEFALPFPAYVFLDLMGMPREMLPQFLEWVDVFEHSPTVEERSEGARRIIDYLRSYVEARRSETRDDLTTAILNGRIGGRPIRDDEIMGMLMLLLLGGLDTVSSSLGWYLRHLAQDAPMQERLRNNTDDIPAAIEELLRVYGVVATRRIVAKDVVFRGVEMKKGDLVFALTYLVGRDEREYDNPHLVDPDRNARHISMATGVHNCLGAHLARRELKIVIGEFLSRFRNIRVVENAPFDFSTHGVWRVTQLSLQWD